MHTRIVDVPQKASRRELNVRLILDGRSLADGLFRVLESFFSGLAREGMNELRIAPGNARRSVARAGKDACFSIDRSLKMNGKASVPYEVPTLFRACSARDCPLASRPHRLRTTFSICTSSFFDSSSSSFCRAFKASNRFKNSCASAIFPFRR